MKKRTPRAEAKEIQDRIDLIETFVIRGMSFYKIKMTIEKLNEDVKFINKINVTERQLRNYIKRAQDNIKNENIPRKKYFYMQSMKRYDDLYNNAVRIQDWKTAANINEKRDRLLGLTDAL